MNARELFAMLMDYPQPARTEVLAELEKLTRNYDQEHATALLSDFEDMLNEWKYNKVVARLEAEYNEKILDPYYTALHNAEYAIAMGTNDPIEWPKEPAPFVAPPPFPGCYDDSFVFVAPMYEYAVEVLKSHAPNKQDSHNSDAAMLPNKGTGCWRILREELIAKGLCRSDDNILIWLSTPKSLAYFAYCLTQTMPYETRRKMGLTKGQQTVWRAFERFMNLTPDERKSKIAPWVTRYAKGDDPLLPADAEIINVIIQKCVQ